MIRQAIHIFDQPNWNTRENKGRLMDLFDSINDNEHGGIPEEILKNC
jgi:hypothetical protein